MFLLSSGKYLHSSVSFPFFLGHIRSCIEKLFLLDNPESRSIFHFSLNRSENSQLVSKYEHSEKHVKELTTLRIHDKEEFQTQLEEYQSTNMKLQGSYERLQSEYEQLLGIKIQLDMELCAYSKLLEG